MSISCACTELSSRASFYITSIETALQVRGLEVRSNIQTILLEALAMEIQDIRGLKSNDLLELLKKQGLTENIIKAFEGKKVFRILD